MPTNTHNKTKASSSEEGATLNWSQIIFGLCLVIAFGFLASGLKSVGGGLSDVGSGVSETSQSLSEASKRLTQASGDLVLAAERVERAAQEYSSAPLSAQNENR